MAHSRPVPRAAMKVVAGGLAGVLAVTLTACGGDPPAPGPSAPASGSASPAAPTPTAAPSAAPSGSASPTVAPPTDPATVFAADGIGPYVIGSTLADLTTRSLVTGVVDSELCAGAKGATATGRYAGQLSLTFNADELRSVHTTSPDLVTPSGARVGMTLAQIQEHLRQPRHAHHRDPGQPGLHRPGADLSPGDRFLP